MENNNKKYITISIAVLIIILIGLLFCFKSNIQKFFSTQTEQDVANLLDKGNQTVDSSDSTDKQKTEEPTVDMNKFNQLITNAHSAYNKKDYKAALNYYNQALTVVKKDVVYSGMFNVYMAEGNWLKAEEVLNKAIALNPLFVEYWKSKLTLLDEKTNATFVELEKIYNEGMEKIDPRTKIDLVTHFARIAENNNEKEKAIALWQKAIELFPTNKTVYQTEIDKLKQ